MSAERELAERILKAWEAQPVDDDSGFAEKVILARAYMAMVVAQHPEEVMNEPQSTSRSRLLQALENFRRDCARAICWKCRELPDMFPRPEFQADPSPTYWHEATECRASSIWLMDLPALRSETVARCSVCGATEDEPCRGNCERKLQK